MNTEGGSMKINVFGTVTRVVVGLAVVAGIAFQPGAARAVDPAAKCESAKLNEVAKKGKCVANIASKSIKKNEAEDAAKLAKCSTKFNEKFAKSETKAGGLCPSNGDASLIETTVDDCVNGVISDLGGAPQGDTGEVKCQSKKAKEAGKYAQCRFKADSKGIKKGLSPDYGKCDTKLSDKWAKIEAKPPCLTTGDLAAVKADIDACQAAIGIALGGLCGNTIINAGEECDDGNTTGGDGCSAFCQNEPLVEYSQDYEALGLTDPDALGTNPGGDGWLVGANVFAGAAPGGGFLYNYFAFTAPNGGPAFSALVSGEGGPEQGSQQLSIYNDYNNGDHATPNTIEAVVFRERPVVAGDVGRTLTFQFDHKAGNINDPADLTCMSPNPPCASTASAFIKTLDPGMGFATIDLISADMTAISTTWGTTLLTLDIDVTKVGFILQVGFQSRASHYQPTGIFYDNVSVSTLPTP